MYPGPPLSENTGTVLLYLSPCSAVPVFFQISCARQRRQHEVRIFAVQAQIYQEIRELSAVYCLIFAETRIPHVLKVIYSVPIRLFCSPPEVYYRHR